MKKRLRASDGRDGREPARRTPAELHRQAGAFGTETDVGDARPVHGTRAEIGRLLNRAVVTERVLGHPLLPGSPFRQWP